MISLDPAPPDPAPPDPAPRPPVRCAVLAPAPHAPGHVLVRSGVPPRLPAVACREAYPSTSGWVADALETATGLRATVLRPLRPAEPDGCGLRLMEPDGPVPAGWRAAPIHALAEPAAVRARLAEALAPAPAGRPAYALPGWRDAARARAATALARLGRRAALFEPERAWGISSVWRVRCADGAGDAWLKAVPPPFEAEPELTRLLAERLPGLVPAVLHADPERGELVLDHAAGDAPAHGDAAAIARLARRMADAQRHAAAGPLTAELRAAGAPARGATLPDEVEGLARGVEAEPLDVAERDALSGLPALVAAARRRLDEALALPPSLVHGDLHPGNALIAPDRVRILDWSDAAIAPPEADLLTLTGWADFDEARHGPALDAWCAGWGLEPERVRAVLPELRTWAAAYHAVSYERIQAAREPGARWELAGIGTRLLRGLARGAFGMPALADLGDPGGRAAGEGAA